MDPLTKEGLMIDKKDVLGSFRQELVKPLAAHRPPPLTPLPISPWMAMSLMQKAVRRGETVRALGAAATLLIDAPDKLWRRLAGIAGLRPLLAKRRQIQQHTADPANWEPFIAPIVPPLTAPPDTVILSP